MHFKKVFCNFEIIVKIFFARNYMQEGLGQYLRKLRKEKHYTLTQMGAKLGVDSGALSKIENNKRPLDEKLLPKLSEIFELDFKQLKEEYFGEKIAELLLHNDCSEEVLDLAKEKLKYKASKQARQTRLDFE